MKLVHPDFQFKISLSENLINKLIIENPRMFSIVVNEISRQSNGADGRFVLSKDNIVIKFADNVICKINPFDINFNDRKVLSKIYGLLKNEVQSSEFWLTANQVFLEVSQFTEQVIETIDYALTYSDEMDISAFFKFMDIKIDVPEQDLTGQVIDYVKLTNQLLGHQVFVFVNLSAYLDFTELQYLYKIAMYQKINLLMIESHVTKLRSQNEKIYIIDEDGCEIH